MMAWFSGGGASGGPSGSPPGRLLTRGSSEARVPAQAILGEARVTEIHGRCDPRFEAVRTAFAANFDHQSL